MNFNKSDMGALIIKYILIIKNIKSWKKKVNKKRNQKLTLPLKTCVQKQQM